MNKELYNEDSSIYNYNIKKRIGSGGDGKIYLLDNGNLLKIFRSPHIERSRDIIKTISKLKLDGIYYIYNILNNNANEFIGYEMKYYQKEDIDILTMPIDYTIDNLIKLYKIADILGKNNIVMHDLIYVNIILNNNGITVIDADSYYLDNFGAISNNKYKIDILFVDLYKKSLEYNHNIITPEATKNIKDLFIGSSIEQVSKKLTKYKYPIDYLKKAL